MKAGHARNDVEATARACACACACNCDAACACGHVDITTGREGTRFWHFNIRSRQGQGTASRAAKPNADYSSRARREKSPKPGFLHKDLALPSSGALICINHDNPKRQLPPPRPLGGSINQLLETNVTTATGRERRKEGRREEGRRKIRRRAELTGIRTRNVRF